MNSHRFVKIIHIEQVLCSVALCVLLCHCWSVWCQLLENHLATHLSVGSHLAWELLQVMQEKNNTTNVFSATENTTNSRDTMWDRTKYTFVGQSQCNEGVSMAAFFLDDISQRIVV